jgi:hypothetical protein
MTLREKFRNFYEGMSQRDSERLEKIADTFAIGFADWLINQDITKRGKNNFVCSNGIERNTKQLLEIYKKEKGL